MNAKNIAILMVLLVMASCEREFQPYLPGKTVPVVYGMISPEDTVLNILLEKSFIGKGSAFDMAQRADSLFFDSVGAWLELRHLNGLLVQRRELKWVEGPVQNVGIFNRRPNWVLAISADDFNMGFEYNDPAPYGYVTLTIHCHDINQDLVAITPLIRKPLITSPRNKNPFPIPLYSEEPFEFAWEKDSVYYEASIVFSYELIRDNKREIKEVQIKYIFKPERKTPYKSAGIQVQGEPLLIKIKNLIRDFRPDDVRRFQSLDFYLYSADPALYYYMKTLSSDLDIDLGTFTNIENGLGIFVLARKTSIKGFTLDYRSLDSLRNSRFTKHLNFVAW